MYRKGVSVLIINTKQEFLLVNLESFEAQFFAVPGGGVDKDEELAEAAYREIGEELGIKKESLEFVGQSKEPVRLVFKTKKLVRDGIEYDGMERFFFGFRFIGNESEIILQEGEIRSYKWVPFGDLKDYLLFDNQLEDTSAKIREIFDVIKD